MKTIINRLGSWLRRGDYAPGEFQLVSWLFLRGLGLVYLSAFVSFGVQALALIGSHGIVPVEALVDAGARQLGAERFWFMPMVFWFDASDLCIQLVCWGGAVLSLLLIFNILPRLCLIFLYLLYLSLIYAGQNFMTFQWDFLLIDGGFLGLLLSIWVRPAIFLLRWLMFRFMFLSGVVKIASGDASWQSLTALTYHFETQPLPTLFAWYTHHLPFMALSFMTFATLFIELLLPFCILISRPMRFMAAFAFLALQTVIAITGNYNFFNLQVIITCIVLFDDAALKRALPKKAIGFLLDRRPIFAPGKIGKYFVGVMAFVILLTTSIQLINAYGVRLPVTWLNDTLAPFRLANTYGPFAIMTTKRREIILEGSNDGQNWQEYAFKYKPGDVTKRPPWNAPHQPRVDWQFWFAALEQPSENRWIGYLIGRLLEGEPHVTALLEKNPFPDQPPHYIRAMFYDYHFTTPDEKAKTGAWWTRKLIGVYFPESSLIVSPKTPKITQPGQPE